MAFNRCPERLAMLCLISTEKIAELAIKNRLRKRAKRYVQVGALMSYSADEAPFFISRGMTFSGVIE